MNGEINLAAVYSNNFIGVVLAVTMLVANRWRLKERDNENRYIVTLLILVLLSCVADPIAYTLDGREGILCRVAIYFTNNWLFLANLLAGYTWILLIEEHLKGGAEKLHVWILRVITLTGIVLLVVNYFKPIVFSIDENNVFERQEFYIYYYVIIGLFILDSLAAYYVIEKNSGFLKFFPIWAYAIPIGVGIIIQSSYYGVSIAWPAGAVSLAGLVTSLQNELIFRDKLTGLYNRYFLDNLNHEYKRLKNTVFTVAMVDINDFKMINDKLGHIVGDEALINTAKIIQQRVKSNGTVIRYAGDEFVLILNAKDKNAAEKQINSIYNGFEEFNRSGKAPYELSVSIGYDVFDLKTSSLDVILADVDKNMYEDKAQYYIKHPEKRRRVG